MPINDDRLLADIIGAANRWRVGAPDQATSLSQWDLTSQTGGRQEVGALLYASIKTLGMHKAVSPNVLEFLRGQFVATRNANRWAYEALDELLPRFECAGIPVILLKGCALAATLYAPNGLRPVGDLDLLVQRQDVGRARTVLGELGYGPLAQGLPGGIEDRYAAQQAFWRERAHPSHVEVHWHLVERSYYRARVPIEWFWERTVPIQLHGRTVRVLSLEALFLHLSIHFAIHHNCRGLKWSYDLALLLANSGRDMDWTELLDAVDRFGLVLPLRAVLETVADTWGIVPPAHVAARLRKATVRWQDRLAFSVAAPYRTATLGFDAFAQTGWRSKIDYLMCLIFPDASFMALRYRVKNPLLMPAFYGWRFSQGLYKVVRSLR